MAVKRRLGDSSASSSVAWTTENELRLFRAAMLHKPAGLAKHFHMALIHSQLLRAGMKDLTSAAIWEHLEAMYNLDKANVIENVATNAITNRGGDDSDNEFRLPKKEFQAVMAEMKKGGYCSEDSRKSLNAQMSTPSGDADNASNTGSESSETPKVGQKRPTRSTPGTGATPAKRRK